MDRETTWRLLSDPDRQHLLARLEPGERYEVDELVRELATGARGDGDRSARENGDGTDRRRRHIRIELVHDHLPRLDDHGVVDYEPDAAAVVPTAALEEVRIDDLPEPLRHPEFAD